MRLINHTLLYLSGSLILVLSVWAVLFYVAMMDEVYDSIDDGLENYKILIIKKAHQDTSILQLSHFDERNYAIRPVSKAFVLQATQSSRDTSMYMEAEADFEIVRMLTTYFTMGQDQYYELKILASMVEEDDLLEDLVFALIWLFLAVIASAYLIEHYILRHIWRPFYQLQDGLDRFELGSQKPFETPATEVREFQSLNQSVERLLAANAKVYQQQKELIENASHELQTPLAVAISQLELIMTESVHQESLNQKLDAVMQQLHRIKRLNKSLLLLSKIENKQFLGAVPTDIVALIEEQVELLQPLATFYQVEVRVHAAQQALVWDLHPDLAQMLFSNLLKNAMIHNHEGGRVDVYFKPNSVSLVNTGTQEALDPQRIFKRFGSEKSNHSNSSGLGLSIAKAIAEQHHLALSYQFEDGLHHFILSAT